MTDVRHPRLVGRLGEPAHGAPRAWPACPAAAALGPDRGRLRCIAPLPPPTSAPTPAADGCAEHGGQRGGHGSRATATPQPTPAPTPEGELFVYNWADYIGDDTISDFEDKYGIKVTYDFFDTTTRMTAKISTGNSGYDVTFPTSIYVKGLLARNLVQPLDLSLIPNVANLAPEWQNPSYDPGNEHSVPYMWWTTGVAYDTAKVKQTLTSWDALWDPQWKGHMAMLDDYREAFSAALIQLGYSINTIDDGGARRGARPAPAAEAAAPHLHHGRHRRSCPPATSGSCTPGAPTSTRSSLTARP